MDSVSEIDVDISRWVLEFLLRQPLDDGLVGVLLHALPLPNDSASLKKILLLRKIESDVISNSALTKKTLRFLEQIAELDFQDKIIEASDALKSAYCALAVHCTVRLLKSSDSKVSERIDTVLQRIWSPKELLVTKHLLDWKDKIEAAVNEQSVLDELIKNSKEINAVEALKVYIMEEKAKMGPSFLEVVAETFRREGDDAIWELIGLRKSVETSDRQTQGLLDGVNSKEVKKGNVLPTGKCVVRKALRVKLSKASGEAKITDVDKSGECPSGKKYDLLRTPEVNKVPGELESSPSKLRVKDPLNNVLRPENGISGIGMEKRDHVALQEKKDGANPEILQSSGGGVGNDCCIHQINAPAPMQKCDDSANRSPKDSPFCHNMLQTRTRKRVVSPSQENDVEKLMKRRKIKRWSTLEEDTLRTGVEKYGKGNWKLILFAYRQIFNGRTEVDLKDKWRNMMR